MLLFLRKDRPRTSRLRRPGWLSRLSIPEDSHEALMEKLGQYRSWGIEHIWVVEPELKEFHVFDSHGLMEVKAFELPGLRIDAAELFAEALK